MPPSDERRKAHIKDIADKHYVFREHETGQEAYIVKSGQIEIFKTITEDSVTREHSLSILQAGTMFGEMALIDNKPRMASARAYRGPASVFVVSQKQFASMLDPVNPFVKKLLEILVNLVRANDLTSSTAGHSDRPASTTTDGVSANSGVTDKSEQR
ncbi:MAG: cyclic nucleotide-binding domain-containing protein [Rhodospirillales bacterium]|nr:cyclic nucleotide-binding domain-containing protein [Rhodospirillales bacterium]